MLAASALRKLSDDLARATSGMGISSGKFGRPEMVAAAAREAERVFQGYAKAKPPQESAYAAARSFLDGVALDAWQRDMLAYAIAEPVREHGDQTVLSSRRFSALLAQYDKEVQAGEIWSLTWHGLLYSYFHYDPVLPSASSNKAGWHALREFLQRTWPLVDRQAGPDFVPDWVTVLRHEADILTAKPVEKYARDYMLGKTEGVGRLAEGLGIPPSSWFWHALVLAAVDGAVAEADSAFQRLIPQLLQLVQHHPGFRDEALERILTRYQRCKGAAPNDSLRDYVCGPSVWKNPKLKSAGIATAWNRVPDATWQMVLSWVNERNLKDFFDILAARNNADEGRLGFWSTYLKQITWTRLVFGADTMALRRTNAGVRDLIAREEGAYARLTGKPEVDGFMMQIGDYLIVEFSKKPNACYVYKIDELPFERYENWYDGGTRDLAAGFHGHPAARIVHRDGWQLRAADDLRRLGIEPDVGGAGSSARPAARALGAVTVVGKRAAQVEKWQGGQGHGPDMRRLEALVARFRGATIDDRRRRADARSEGRLWVDDPIQRPQLATELQSLGFKWASKRGAWYYPES